MSTSRYPKAPPNTPTDTPVNELAEQDQEAAGLMDASLTIQALTKTPPNTPTDTPINELADQEKARLINASPAIQALHVLAFYASRPVLIEDALLTFDMVSQGSGYEADDEDEQPSPPSLR